jgi:hypothetical protein
MQYNEFPAAVENESVTTKTPTERNSVGGETMSRAHMAYFRSESAFIS